MSTQLTVKDMAPTHSLNQYFLDRMTDVLLKYGFSKDQYDLQVLVSESSHRTMLRPPSFECRLVLRLFKNKGPLIITQENSDFFVCSKQVENILEKKIRREKSKFVDKKRKRLPLHELKNFTD